MGDTQALRVAGLVALVALLWMNMPVGIGFFAGLLFSIVTGMYEDYMKGKVRGNRRTK